ncbi:MAG: MerR family transcriptional regulator [Alistipes sp.]
MEVKKLFYSMGEVSELFDVNPSLIRYWEAQFDVLRPTKNKKGNRMFSPQDVEYLKLIYHLVKERGMTLDGAKKSLKQNQSEISRDAALLERLQRVRSLLVEVREELKMDEAEPVVTTEKPAVATVIAEKPAVESSSKRRPGRPSRVKKEEATIEKELFAFYEQSLFEK